MRRTVVFSLVACLTSLVACGDAEVTRSPGSTLDVGGISVFAVERPAAAPVDEIGPVVLFLHGASFTAEVWVETGLLDDVAAAGFDAVAVDVPGYGLTEEVDVAPASFLASLVEVVDEGRGVVVVSPSMSGSFTLPLLVEGPLDHLAGVVPVAPVGSRTFIASATEPVDVPALVVWGTEDDVIEPAQADALAAAFVDGRVVLVDGAGHAAYRDEPEAFGEVLIDFVGGLGG